MFTTGKWLVVSAINIVRCNQYCEVVLQNVFTEKKDVSLKKYNEDNVNYANSKPRVFKVGIM